MKEPVPLILPQGRRRPKTLFTREALQRSIPLIDTPKDRYLAMTKTGFTPVNPYCPAIFAPQ